MACSCILSVTPLGNRTNTVALPFCHLVLRASKPKSSEYPNQLKTLGDPLRAKRLRLGWLQIDLAKHFGVAENTIWRWERNESTPSIRYIPKMVAFLGYNPLPQPESLREKLILIRKLLGLSQKAMARRLEVDETTLRCFEREIRHPSKKLKRQVESFLRTGASEA